MFDPNQFLDMQVTESNDTVIAPVPVGEYIAVAEEVKVRTWQAKDDPSNSGLALDITWSIDDEALKQELGRSKVTSKQGIMLELTDSGGIDMGKGKNVDLGRLRLALDLNTPGQPFAFSMIPGRMAKILIKHRMDKNDPEKIYAEVKGVTKYA